MCRASAVTLNPTQFWVYPPILKCNTASYEDNQYILWRLKMYMEMRNPGMTHAFVVGDEQTFQRMIHMKQLDKFAYSWLIPMPGEFHMACHMLHCEYRLFYKAILKPVAVQTHKTNIHHDHKVQQFNVHELYYLTVVQAVWTFLEECFGEDLKMWRRALVECEENYFAKTLLYFIFDGALPYLMWRRLVRMPPSKERRTDLNKIYRLYAWRYVAMNKTNYGPLCFHALYMYENLTAPLQDVWDKVYNASIKGHPGRNVALDHLMEKINRMAKQLVGTSATEDRIAAIVPEINVVAKIETAHDLLTPGNAFNPLLTGKPRLEPDVEAVLQLFRVWLPRGKTDLTAPGRNNALTGEYMRTSKTPWKRLKKAKKKWREYATEKLNQFNFTAPYVDE